MAIVVPNQPKSSPDELKFLRNYEVPENAFEEPDPMTTEEQEESRIIAAEVLEKVKKSGHYDTQFLLESPPVPISPDQKPQNSEK